MTQTRFGARIMLALLAGAVAGGLSAAGTAQAMDKVIFQTNWRAEAEHGGFYQALATGIYKKYGIDATIRMGGPQQDPSAMLLAGKVDFIMANGLAGLNYAKEKLPFIVIASAFQKDPQVLLSHASAGIKGFADMKGKPIMIGATARTSFWPFLRVKFGFTDDQIRPYTFNMAPFIADKKAIQQAFLTSEPYAIRKASGEMPVVHLLADAGYDNYQETINTSVRLVKEKPDLVQRFVNASIEGWYSYLNNDPAPANALIRKDNPDMSEDEIAYSIKAMKEHGIVDSGDSKKFGIGAMTDERWARFAKVMIQAGLYPADLDVKKAYTLQFVNKKVGM